MERLPPSFIRLGSRSATALRRSASRRAMGAFHARSPLMAWKRRSSKRPLIAAVATNSRSPRRSTVATGGGGPRRPAPPGEPGGEPLDPLGGLELDLELGRIDPRSRFRLRGLVTTGRTAHRRRGLSLLGVAVVLGRVR